MSAPGRPTSHAAAVVDVLDKQVELVRWWQSSIYRQSVAEHFKFMIERYAVTDIPLDRYLSDRMDTAETFYVRANIVDRLWEFTDVYEAHEHETVEQRDLPCPRGFIYLEKAVYLIDARGKVASVKAVLWSEEKGGVSIVQFSDAFDPRDEINRDLYAGGDAVRDRIEPGLALFHIMPWSWGRNVRNLGIEDFSYEKDDPAIQDHIATAVVSTDRFNGFVLGLWEFVQEQIPHRIRAPRPMVRRLARAGSGIIPEVTVVDLRTVDQPYDPADPDRDPLMFWTHRWRSREHKRRWIDKKGNYRETTVSASVKGPKHLPLIEKDRVYHVRR